MSDAPSFADFLTAAEPKEPDAAPGHDALDGGTDAELHQNADATTKPLEATAETPATDQEQVATSSESRVQFEDILRQKGADINDDLDPKDLYETAAERIMAASQTMQENERLRLRLAELEALQSGSHQTSAAPPQQQAQTPQEAQASDPVAQAEARARRFRELNRPDPVLNNYINRNENGFAVPREGYGQVAVDAAQKINEFERASQEQAELILQNPYAIVEDNRDLIESIATEKARALLEDRFNEFQSQTEEQKQRQLQAEHEAAERARIEQWQESHKDKLFRVNPQTGEILTDVFGTGDLVRSEVGKRFFDKLYQLRTRLPEGTPEVELYDLAFELSGGNQEQGMPAEQQRPQEALTQAEKKQRLADNRQVVPNQNTPAATALPPHQQRRTLKFADLAASIPENAERSASW